MYKINESQFQSCLTRLVDYVHKEQTVHNYGTKTISFQSGYLYEQEGYKSELSEKAEEILAVDSWKSDVIGTGALRDRVSQVLHLKTNANEEHNLLIWSEKKEIEQWMDANLEDAETLLFLLFTCNVGEEESVFEEFVTQWGARYPMISFMFFLKDPNRYASMRPDNMKGRFKELGIETDCTKSCTWENYCEFIEVLSAVRDKISPVFGLVSLTDAHSFVWAIHLIAASTDGDEELSDLLSDNSQERVKLFIKHFVEALPEYEKEERVLEEKRKEFVSDFPVKRILSMQKEDYVVGLKSQNTFCYRIETQLKELGNMKGATSAKFGLYFGVSGEDKEEKYRATKKFGNDPDEAFEKIQEELVKLILAGNQKDEAAIRASAFSPLFRGKILATYFPDTFLPIFSVEHLNHLLSCLGIVFADSDDVLDKQNKLITWKNNRQELRELSLFLYQRFLYRSFGAPLEKKLTEKEHESEWTQYYPRDYAQDVGISVARWKRLLRDERVFHESDVQLLKRFYLTEHHAAACNDFALQDGVSPTSFISPVVAMAKRVSNEVGLKPIYRDNGSRIWWRILFWGRNREDGCFEWMLQPDLAAAISEVFPELDRSLVNEEEDNRLLEDLKQTRVDHFKQIPVVNEPAPRATIIVNGSHPAYPRDRKIALNALAIARHTCECDPNHQSFIRRRSDCRYMEPHHLVPMAFQDSFNYSLDREQNIVSLCSNCHNEIHYGRDAAKLLRSLYEQRKEALSAIGIKITFHDLMTMYGLDESE